MITDEEAKSALLVLCKSHCCWGSKAAREMNILTMKTTNAFHVVIIINNKNMNNSFYVYCCK